MIHFINMPLAILMIGINISAGLLDYTSRGLYAVSAFIEDYLARKEIESWDK